MPIDHDALHSSFIETLAQKPEVWQGSKQSKLMWKDLMKQKMTLMQQMAECYEIQQEEEVLNTVLPLGNCNNNNINNLMRIGAIHRRLL